MYGLTEVAGLATGIGLTVLALLLSVSCLIGLRLLPILRKQGLLFALIAAGMLQSMATKVTTRTLPEATEMVAYAVTLEAKGTDPVTWREVSDTVAYEDNSWNAEAVRTMGTNVWTTLATAGEAMGWRADEGAWPLELPFDFGFYGRIYRRVWVSSNGHVALGEAITNAVADLTQGCVLAPLGGRNLRTDRGADDIFVATNADEVVIRWSAARHDDDEFEYPGAYRFAVVLTKEGGVRFVYGLVSYGDTDEALVGIGSGAAGRGWQWSPARSAYWLNEADDFVFTTSYLPQGITLSDDGTLSGTTDAPSGTYAVLAEATDAAGETDVRQISLVVEANANCRPAVVASAAAAVAHHGSNVVFSVAASDPEGVALAYAWSVDGTAQPSSADSLAWSPGDDDVGYTTVTCTVRDDLWAIAASWRVYVPLLYTLRYDGASPQATGVPAPSTQEARGGREPSSKLDGTGGEPSSKLDGTSGETGGTGGETSSELDGTSGETGGTGGETAGGLDGTSGATGGETAGGLDGTSGETGGETAGGLDETGGETGGVVIAASAPTREGWRFEGWTNAALSATLAPGDWFDDAIVTGHVFTLYAAWSADLPRLYACTDAWGTVWTYRRTGDAAAIVQVEPGDDCEWLGWPDIPGATVELDAGFNLPVRDKGTWWCYVVSNGEVIVTGHVGKWPKHVEVPTTLLGLTVAYCAEGSLVGAENLRFVGDRPRWNVFAASYDYEREGGPACIEYAATNATWRAPIAGCSASRYVGYVGPVPALGVDEAYFWVSNEWGDVNFAYAGSALGYEVYLPTNGVTWGGRAWRVIGLEAGAVGETTEQARWNELEATEQGGANGLGGYYSTILYYALVDCGTWEMVAPPEGVALKPIASEGFTLQLDANGVATEFFPAYMGFEAGQCRELPTLYSAQGDYAFVGWASSPYDLMPQYMPGDPGSGWGGSMTYEDGAVGGCATLYAVWRENERYTLHFDGACAAITNAAADIRVNVGEYAALPAGPEREGWTFECWTNAENGARYLPGDYCWSSGAAGEVMTFAAQWSERTLRGLCVTDAAGVTWTYDRTGDRVEMLSAVCDDVEKVEVPSVFRGATTVVTAGGFRVGARTQVHVDGSVAKSGDGTTKETAFRTIPKALMSVGKSGMTVVVHPGTYLGVPVRAGILKGYDAAAFPEGFAVTLTATGGCGSAVIDAEGLGTCAALCGEWAGKVACTFENFALTRGLGGATGVCLKNCLVTNNAGWGVADATAVGCRIAGNDGVGAWNAVVRDCRIEDNAGAGVVASCATGCRIAGNAGGGVSNVAWVASCEVIGNGGVGVTDAGEVSNCVVACHAAAGVTAVDAVVGCTVVSNALVGVTAARLVSDSVLSDNGEEGVRAVDVVRRTRVCANAGDGVSDVRKVLACDVVGNAGYGVRDCRLISGGSVSSNGADGVVGVPIVDRVTIAANAGLGLEGGRATFCRIRDNLGGGTVDAELVNCVISGNRALWGAGACGGTLYHCTVVSNRSLRAHFPSGVDWDAVVYNSILWDNLDRSGNVANYYYDSAWPEENTRLIHSCAFPATPYEAANIAEDPRFASEALDLRADSPCCDRAAPAYVRTVSDMRERMRVQGRASDMGAYETGEAGAFDEEETAAAAFGEWLGDYPEWIAPYEGEARLAANHLSGKTDGEGRPMTLWEDYVCGTSPTNADEIFTADIALEDGGPAVSWRPDLGSARRYTVWGAETLSGPWRSVSTNEVRSCGCHFFKLTVSLP